MRIKLLIGILLIILFVIAACNIIIEHDFRHSFNNQKELLQQYNLESSYIKAHMKNGELYVFLNKWELNQEQTIIKGVAKHYNFNRNLIDSKYFEIPISDVSIFETNQPIKNRDASKITLLSILTGVDVAIGIVCLTNPKACFGSCPTFYYENDNNIYFANAEGFSSSISPSLEAGDIDALNNPPISNRNFTLTMKNEALENHAVNQIKLLAVPRHSGKRIFQDNNNSFYECDKLQTPDNANYEKEDIIDKINKIDAKEWFSLSDPKDLRNKEEINLSFNNTNDIKSPGFLINFRQTLLTTFLFYTVYGYMGDEAGYIFSKIETDEKTRKRVNNIFDILGGIEILAYNENQKKWEYIETLNENGPIAKNLQISPLPSIYSKQDKIKLKLRMTKGLWRIDYTALANIVNSIKAIEISPTSVTRNDKIDNEAMKNIADDDENYEASLPGDKYKINFILPDTVQDYELFVYSKGYYLEWMRKSWLADKNLLKLKLMTENNSYIWKNLSRHFKLVENEMESTFWGSKITEQIKY